MKKINLLLLFVGLLAYTQAQVGINTKSPLGTFHVDPKGDTGGTKNNPTLDSDDVIITDDGRMGIGTANPDSNVKLDIRGKIRIADGSQDANKLLTAIDNTGVAEWREPLLSVETGTLNGNSVSLHTAVAGEFVDITTKRITLSPGKWLIMAKMSTQNSGVSTLYSWIRLLKQEAPDDVIVNTMGLVPESQNGLIATPSLSYLVDVPTNSTYYIAMYGPCNCAVTLSYEINPRYGGSYFYAIKLN